MKQKKTFLTTALIFGYAFLYIPIGFVVISSFNYSRFPSVWGGFSLRWYKELFDSDDLLPALFASLKIATLSATCAVVLGTLAAVVMVRFRRFWGRNLFSGLISAPLVVPDVIAGLAFLMMFITLDQLIGWPGERGLLTITIAHITLGMAYVYVIIQYRLLDFDQSLEEAGLDLGARPATVFLKVTLPIISPALASGWLLAFALSLDDVVLASFLTGPGTTTLPMLIFSSIRLGVRPEISALASLIIGIVILIALSTALLIHRKKRYR